MKITEGLLRFKIKINQSGSSINGLATVWTLVFTKLVVISGLILSQETLTGSEYSNLTLKVAWLNGNLPYGWQRTSILYGSCCICFSVLCVLCVLSCNYSFLLPTCASDYAENP